LRRPASGPALPRIGETLLLNLKTGFHFFARRFNSAQLQLFDKA
jgi:hypothetical protein